MLNFIFVWQGLKGNNCEQFYERPDTLVLVYYECIYIQRAKSIFIFLKSCLTGVATQSGHAIFWTWPSLHSRKNQKLEALFIYVANLFILVEYHSEKQNPVFLFSCITSMQSICLKKNHSHTLKRRESDVWRQFWLRETLNIKDCIFESLWTSVPCKTVQICKERKTLKSDDCSQVSRNCEWLRYLINHLQS